MERVKTSIFIEVVLALETKKEPQEKTNLSIFKDEFSSKTDPSILTSVAWQLFEQLNQTSRVCSIESNKPLPTQFHSIT